MKKRRDIKKQTAIKKRKNLGKKLGKGLALSAFTIGGVLILKGQDIEASEMDGKWEARSIEQIKKDVEGKKEYTIVWGDTLSGISLATNVTMEKLASYVARAENFPGYELVGSSTKELKNITSSQEIVFNYNKVDKGKLTSALKSLDSLTEADYTPISWEKLMGSKDAATDIVNKKDATQKEVNDRLTDLNARIKELVKRADTQDLQTLYLGAKGMGPQRV